MFLYLDLYILFSSEMQMIDGSLSESMNSTLSDHSRFITGQKCEVVPSGKQLHCYGGLATLFILLRFTCLWPGHGNGRVQWQWAWPMTMSTSNGNGHVQWQWAWPMTMGTSNGNGHGQWQWSRPMTMRVANGNWRGQYSMAFTQNHWIARYTTVLIKFNERTDI